MELSAIPASFRGLQKRSEMDLENIYFMCIDAKDMAEIFAPGEVDRIYLNFSDPCKGPPCRELTSLSLCLYTTKFWRHRVLLNSRQITAGCLNIPWNPFQMPAGEITEYTFDLHNSPMAEGNVMTEYEMKFASEGKPSASSFARRTGTFGQDPA